MARKIKAFTKSEARAAELAGQGSTIEVERAYDAASRLGQGNICDIYLREFDRRAA